MTAHSGVFVSLAPLSRSVRRFETVPGAAFRYSSHAAIPGSVPPRPTHKYPDLNPAAFQAWCHTHEHVTSGVRRVRMLEVRSFCLYRRRTEPQCFVPDPAPFRPIINGSSHTFSRRPKWRSCSARLRA